MENDADKPSRPEPQPLLTGADYRAIFEAANDAIFIHDPHTGAILDCNSRMREMYGYSSEEVRRLDVERLSAGTPPFTQDEALRHISKAVGGEAQFFEWLAKAKSGRLFWVEVNLKLVSVGGQQRLLAIVRDITERRQQSEERERLLAEVQRTASELDATLASVADGLIVYDQAGQVATMNAAARRIFAWTDEEIGLSIAARWAAINARNSEGRLFTIEEIPVYRALHGEEVHGATVRILRPSDREVWLSVSAAPVRTGGGVWGAVATYTDITGLHDLQAHREDFVRAISHDLRQPITVILGQAQPAA